MILETRTCVVYRKHRPRANRYSSFGISTQQIRQSNTSKLEEINAIQSPASVKRMLIKIEAVQSRKVFENRFFDHMERVEIET